MSPGAISVSDAGNAAAASEPLGAASAASCTSMSGVHWNCRAPAAFNRVPVMVTSCMAATGSAPPRIAALIMAGVASETNPFSRAATPATWGAAIDVPLAEAYAPPGDVLRMPAPGAPRWTVVAP